MLVPLCKCLGCDLSPDTSTFPLCLLCSETLLHCPRLCPNCLELSCSQSGERPSLNPCDFPWLNQSSLCSLTAIYLNLGQGYEILKLWKKRGGPLLDRRILKMDAHTLKHIDSLNSDLIVPIPQNYHRSWTLGRSPASQLAHWIGSIFNIPVNTPLHREYPDQPYKRQAELPLEMRMEQNHHYRVIDPGLNHSNPRVLLVDDFVTTGRTLKNAALALKAAGASKVHGFCLGLRPRKRDPVIVENILDA